MNEKYIVWLTDQKRNALVTVVRRFSGTSEEVRRAQTLLEADANSPNWTDRRLAEAFGCRRQTVEIVRPRLAEHDFREALERSRCKTPPAEKLLSGEQRPESLLRGFDRHPRLRQLDAPPAGPERGRVRNRGIRQS